MLLELVAAMALGAASTSACGAGLRPSHQAETFPPATRAQLGELSAQVSERFAGAAAQGCREGWLTPDDLAGYDQLLIEHGAAAAEPLLYFDEERGWRTLVLQFAFNAGRMPEPAQLAGAIRCWKQPEREEC